MVEQLIAWMLAHYGQILIFSFSVGALSVAVPKYFEARRNIEIHSKGLARLIAKRDALMVKHHD